MVKNRKLLTVIAAFLLVVTSLVAVLAPLASASNGSANFGSSPLISKADDLSIDYSQFFNASSVFALPEGIDPDEEISLIIDTQDKTLLEAYDASGSDLTFGEYCKTDEAAKLMSLIQDNNDTLIAKLKEADVDFTVGERYDTLFTGFEIVIEAGDFELASVALGTGVDVIVGEVYEASDAQVVENKVDVYDTGIFNSSASKYDGSGMVVAVLDTGLDYTHSAFALSNFTSTNLGMTFEELSTLVSSTVASGFHESLTTEDVYLNIKVPYAYDYADKDTDVMPLANEHGTHVAGIIAGKNDTITGVAPNAQLAIMKVFSDLKSGAKTSWMLAALEDCVVLGVDVINMSLGSSYGFSRDIDDERINKIYNAIRERGTSLIVSAGNSANSTRGSEKNGNLGLTSNPDSATVGSPSTYKASLSIASIDGVATYYLLYNDRIIYYTEAADRVSEDKNFVDDLLGTGVDSMTVEYVVIPGVGREADYTGIDVTGKIALVARGNTTFEEKSNTAEEMGALGVIIYNNVSGEIKMTVGDTKIAVCSISQDDGELLAAAGTGSITISRAQSAGPFMSSFSSWGPSPDLSIKPEVTAHGGSILSSVPGEGYERMSGTSMAAPNAAGVATLLRQYVSETFFASNRDQFGNLSAEDQMKVTAMVNRLMMSTADVVINKNGLPYSVRKQGAGLVNLADSTNTGAYILTYDRYDGSVMDKSKIELGDDPEKKGVYTLKFSIDNFGTGAVSYDIWTYVMTEGVSETLTTDGKTTVTEEGYVLEGTTVTITEVVGAASHNGTNVTVAAGTKADVTVTLTLSDEDKDYLNKSFANGMFVEGYVMLTAKEGTATDLNVPYLAFYGDWTEAPIFDIDYFATNADELDDSIDLLDKTLPDAYATRVLGGLYDDYISYLGGYYFIQKPGTKMIAADRKYISISNQEKSVNSLKSVWAGMLRNCEHVLITIVDSTTGEVVYTRTEYGIRKSPSNGSAIYGSTVDIEFSAMEQKLKNNTEYYVTLQGFLDYGDGGEAKNDNDTFEFPLMTDFEAPIVTDCEFYTEYDKASKTNRLYAKVAVYDNHYSMAAIPGYITDGINEETGKPQKQISNFEQYPIQIYSGFNSTSYIVYELTDYVDDIKQNSADKNSFCIGVYDYAMNEGLYEISLPNEFVDLYFAENEVTLSPNQTYSLTPIVYPNTEWTELLYYSSSDENVVRVINGELVAVGSGSATVTAKTSLDDGSVKTAEITVKVLKEGDEGYRRYDKPSVSHFVLTGYDTIKAYYMLASEDRDIGKEGDKQVFIGDYYSVELYPSETIKLLYELEDYFDNTEIVFQSSNDNIVTVDEDGTIKGVAEGFASVSVKVLADGKSTFYTKTVNITVKEPYITLGPSLSHYFGLGGKVTLPDTLALTDIGDYAFSNYEYVPKDLNAGDVIDEEDPYNTKPMYIGDDTITEIVIPEGIKTIGSFAFAGLTKLEKITLPSTLVRIGQGAFEGCTALTTVAGLENVKFINNKAFLNCDLTGDYRLDNVIAISDNAFENNKNLTSVTLPESAQSLGSYTFTGCTGLKSVDIRTEKIKIGEYTFSDCSALTEFTLNAAVISAGTFSGCTELAKMTIGKDVSQIGEYAFRGTKIAKFTLADGNTTYKAGNGGEYLTSADGTRLVLVAPKLTTLTVNDSKVVTVAMGAASGNANLKTVNIPSVTVIEKYAFADCDNLDSVTFGTLAVIGDYAFYDTALSKLPNLSGVEKIGDYAFSYADLISVDIPAGITVGKNAFANCPDLIKISIGDNVTIGEYAFTYLRGTNYTTQTYEENGKTIYYVVFKSPVNTLTIGKNVNIGKGAFSGNGSLRNVTLGDGAIIGDQAFYNATGIEVIDLSGAASIGERAFSGDMLYEFFLEDGKLVPAYDTSSNGLYYTYRSRSYGSAITEADLSSATSVGDGAFMYNDKLTKVTLGKDLATVSPYAFAQCKSLTTVNFDNVTEIGDYAFASTAISEANLGKVKNVGSYAFAMCASLTGVTFGEEIASVKEYAFYGCEKLDTATGIDKISSFGDYSFALTDLTVIDVSSATEIGALAFMKDKAQKVTLTLGDSITELGDNPFANCISDKLFITEDVIFNEVKVGEKTTYTYDISENIKVIDGSLYRVVPSGYELVSYFGEGGSVSVPMDTVRISDMAFAGTEVTDVLLPYTVASIGHKAFFGCERLAVVTFTSYEAPILEEMYDQAYHNDPNNWPSIPTEDIPYGMGLIEYRLWSVANASTTLYGANFVDYIGKIEDKIVMVRPSNGLNYSTFTFDQYFSTVINGKPAADSTTLSAIAAINKLPDTVSLTDEALVIAARAAYDRISTIEQRSLVTEYAKLTKAEKRIEDLKYLANEGTGSTEPEPPKDDNIGDTATVDATVVLIIVCSVLGVAVAALAAALVIVVLRGRNASAPAVEEAVTEEKVTEEAAEETAAKATEAENGDVE